jgi:hypothetical protein
MKNAIAYRRLSKEAQGRQTAFGPARFARCLMQGVRLSSRLFTGAKKGNANLPHQITRQLFDFVGRFIVLHSFCTLIDNAPKEATPILATSSKTASAR